MWSRTGRVGGTSTKSACTAGRPRPNTRQRRSSPAPCGNWAASRTSCWPTAASRCCTARATCGWGSTIRRPRSSPISICPTPTGSSRCPATGRRSWASPAVPPPPRPSYVSTPPRRRPRAGAAARRAPPSCAMSSTSCPTRRTCPSRRRRRWRVRSGVRCTPTSSPRPTRPRRRPMDSCRRTWSSCTADPPAASPACSSWSGRTSPAGASASWTSTTAASPALGASTPHDRASSAGGWTTLAAITTTAVFKAATSYYGISDLKSFADETHDFESRYLFGLIGPLPGFERAYEERSPLRRADRASCPVLLLQGLDDPIVLPAQSEKFATALADRKLPYAYLTFEGESHGFRRADTLITCLESELSFYGQIFGFDPPDVPTIELTVGERPTPVAPPPPPA